MRRSTQRLAGGMTHWHRPEVAVHSLVITHRIGRSVLDETAKAIHMAWNPGRA
jgi:hypothetical protein